MLSSLNPKTVADVKTRTNPPRPPPGRLPVRLPHRPRPNKAEHHARAAQVPSDKCGAIATHLEERTMMMGEGATAGPVAAAKFGIDRGWRVLLVGAAALLSSSLSFASGARAETIARAGEGRSGSLLLKTGG